MTAVRSGLAIVLAAQLSACAALTRPEGNGGWSPARRREELARAAEERPAASGGAATVAPAPGEPWDLRAALAHAEQHNRRLAEAEQDLAIAGAHVADARGRLLPSTVGSGRYTWYTDAQRTSVELPPNLLPAGTTPPVVEVRDREAGVLNGTLTLPLDLSGEIRHALLAAQAGFRGEAARVWATRLEQDTQVVRAYCTRLEAERLREVTLQTLALYGQQLSNAEERFRNGRLTKNQLLVVQVARRNAEQLLQREDLAIARARWAFNQVVGLAIDAPSTVRDLSIRPEVPDAAAAWERARAHNPMLVSLLEEQQRLEASATALERSRFPRFSAGGAIDYTSSDILQPQDIGSGFVGFTWDLGTDTRREAQIRAARLAAEQNRIRLDRQMREIEAALRTAQRAAEERLTALDTAQVAVGQAEENLRIRQQQFDAGRATSEDVLDAEALLTRERATVATALYQAHARRAELQQLMGEPLDALLPAER